MEGKEGGAKRDVETLPESPMDYVVDDTETNMFDRPQKKDGQAEKALSSVFEKNVPVIITWHHSLSHNYRQTNLLEGNVTT